jgi:radical SAM protein with 4Fe4S-binding SPASM domain
MMRAARAALLPLVRGGAPPPPPLSTELVAEARRQGVLSTLRAAVARAPEAWPAAAREELAQHHRGQLVRGIQQLQVAAEAQRRLDGIRRLVERGVPLKLKTMLMSWNRDELPAMRQFARDLGLGFKHDGLLNARVDCGASRYGEVQLPPEELVALEMEEPETRQRLEASAEEVRALAGKEWDDPYVYSCGAGQVAFTVDPYGRLQMCQLSRRAAFDLREESFAQVWNERFPALRARPWQTHAVCRQCNLTPLCGSCPGAAELETGDIQARVPQFCRIAHGLAFALLGEASGHRQDASCCLGGGAEEPLAASAAAAPDRAARRRAIRLGC